MKKRVLITGINGFAGSHLAEHLGHQGYEVFGVSHHSETKNQKSWVERIYSVDLRDYEALKGVIDEVIPTHVVHLAAISFIGHDKIKEIYDTNIVGSRCLLQALSDAAVAPECVLMTSSANVYGNVKEGMYSEQDAPYPVNDYAVSKISMEYMTRLFREKLPICIVRPFNYTGCGQSEDFLIPKIVNHFKLEKRSIELGNIDVFRDFSDVRMVVKYLQLMMESSVSKGNTYNICTGTPTSLKSIIEICENLCGYNITIDVNKRLIRENEIRILIGSPEKLHQDFGTLPNYAMVDTLRWMLAK